VGQSVYNASILVVNAVPLVHVYLVSMFKEGRGTESLCFCIMENVLSNVLMGLDKKELIAMIVKLNVKGATKTRVLSVMITIICIMEIV